MSQDQIFKRDYNQFTRNRMNAINNDGPNGLSSTDLRNKINSNRLSSENNDIQEREKRQNARNDSMTKERQMRNSIKDVKILEQSDDLELYKEYVQWDFINNRLYSKVKQLLKVCNGGRAEQELINTIQRWLIFINEHYNCVNKCEYFPILPRVTSGGGDLVSENIAAQFLQQAIFEKRFVSTEDHANEITTLIMQYIATNHANVIPHSLAIAAGEPLLHVEYNTSRKIIVVNKFQSPEVPRVDLLVSKAGIVASARMLLRYESFGNGSYQWGDPKEVHRVLHEKFNVAHEGFASPVNSRFIEYENAHFCSLFPDTDEVFGSLGNFFDVDMRKHCGGWSVNPPFLNDLMKNVADRINQVLDDGCPCYFFCTFPWWDDDEGWRSLNNSKHLRQRFDLRAHHFIVQDAYGHKFEPKMGMNLFVLGEMPPGVARLTELGNILIFNNSDALPDICPW